jgi:hypothetical protein
VTYSGGQRSAKKAATAAPGNVLQGVADFLNRAGIGVSRSAAAAERGPRLVPLRSDQLPPGAFMKETGEVRGMSSEMVPKGGYMTETGRVYVPEGFAGFQRQGPPVPGRLQNAPVAPILPPPTTQAAAVAPSGSRGAAPGQGTTPIVQSSDDQYRQLLSQYGALTKAGEQEKAEQLGMEIWNKKYGKTAMAQPGGAVGARNPLMEKMFDYQAGASTTNPSYAGSTIGSEDFAMAANAVPAPWNQQGVKVSSDFSGVVPFQAAKTTGEGMPAFQTTGEKAEEFLRNVKLGSLF